MSKLLIDSTTLTNIADAIRNKIDSVDLYSPAEMAARIWEIQNSNNFKLGQKIITTNGIYNSSDDLENPLDGYSRVIVSVLNQYAARDENKVVKNGELVSQTSLSINKNGTYDTTTNNSIEVQVPSESAQLGSKIIKENGVYHASDDNYEGYYSVEVDVPKQDISLGTKTFLIRGEYSAEDDNLDGYSTVIVDTTNSYLDKENHMVVVGQRLMSQTSTQISENGIYDTTLNNETTVNVQPPLQNKTITENGTFAADTGYYGLGTVIVNLPNTYYISDIDKVVLSNGLSVQTSRTITSNGSYNTTTNNQVTVSVPFDLDLIEGNITYSNLNRSDITKIRMHTFRELSVLTNISLPNCLNIGDSAFYRCSNISMVSAPNCSYIGSYAFYSCPKISVVFIPNCLHISGRAFAYCYGLSTISFSKCSYIGDYAFENCYSLSTISLPNCSYIRYGAFENCQNLSTISLPNCSYIKDYAFGSCRQLINVFLPNCSSIGSGAFNYCSQLVSITLPQCLELFEYTFSNCRKLETINLPNCQYISGHYIFYNCYNLSTISLPNCTKITSCHFLFAYCSNLTTVSLPKCTEINAAYMFEYCSRIKSLYLMNSTVCTLVSAYCFYSDNFTRSSTTINGYASIYVPQSLLSQYQTATNWSSLRSRFVGI